MEKGTPSKNRNKFWKHHIAQWEKMDLSQAAYCRRNDLRPNRFTYWKKKFQRETTSTQLVKVPEETVAAAADSFSQIGRICHSPSLQLCVPTGFTIEIPDGFSSATLTRILQVLKEV